MPTKELVKVKERSAPMTLTLVNGDEITVHVNPKEVYRMIGDDGVPLVNADREASPVYNMDMNVRLTARRPK